MLAEFSLFSACSAWPGCFADGEGRTGGRYGGCLVGRIPFVSFRFRAKIAHHWTWDNSFRRIDLVLHSVSHFTTSIIQVSFRVLLNIAENVNFMKQQGFTAHLVDLGHPCNFFLGPKIFTLFPVSTSACARPIPLGMSDGQIPDSSISASTEHAQYPARHGRLDGYGAWCAVAVDTSQWLQVDLGEVKEVMAVSMQGRLNDSWVKSFFFQFSADEATWYCYGHEEGSKVTSAQICILPNSLPHGQGFMVDFHWTFALDSNQDLCIMGMMHKFWFGSRAKVQLEFYHKPPQKSTLHHVDPFYIFDLRLCDLSSSISCSQYPTQYPTPSLRAALQIAEYDHNYPKRCFSQGVRETNTDKRKWHQSAIVLSHSLFIDSFSRQTRTLTRGWCTCFTRTQSLRVMSASIPKPGTTGSVSGPKSTDATCPPTRVSENSFTLTGVVLVPVWQALGPESSSFIIA